VYSYYKCGDNEDYQDWLMTERRLKIWVFFLSFSVRAFTLVFWSLNLYKYSLIVIIFKGLASLDQVCQSVTLWIGLWIGLWVGHPEKHLISKSTKLRINKMPLKADPVSFCFLYNLFSNKHQNVGTYFFKLSKIRFFLYCTQLPGHMTGLFI
jgi:hypothetical protein